MICKNCGREMPSQVEHCYYCGQRLYPEGQNADSSGQISPFLKRFKIIGLIFLGLWIIQIILFFALFSAAMYLDNNKAAQQNFIKFMETKVIPLFEKNYINNL